MVDYTAQPDLHAPGWPEMRFHGRAKTDGTIWWFEKPMEDGSIKRQPLQPYNYITSVRCERDADNWRNLIDAALKAE